MQVVQFSVKFVALRSLHNLQVRTVAGRVLLTLRVLI